MAARLARLAVAVEIKAKQGVASVIERGGDVGVTPAVFTQAMHQADDSFGRGIGLPALEEKVKTVRGL